MFIYCNNVYCRCNIVDHKRTGLSELNKNTYNNIDNNAIFLAWRVKNSLPMYIEHLKKKAFYFGTYNCRTKCFIDSSSVLNRSVRIPTPPISIPCGASHQHYRMLLSSPPTHARRSIPTATLTPARPAVSYRPPLPTEPFH